MENDVGYYLTKLLVILSFIVFALVCFAKINTEEYKQAIKEGKEKAIEEQKEREKRQLGDGIYTWTDPETGIEYIIWEGYRKGGITPRIKPEE